jgi:hydroxypyruvate isomerase
MPKFCANLSMLFAEHPFLDRFAAAARAGFTAVEFQFAYDQDQSAVAERLAANGLTQVLFNLPPGDFARGERGIACHPGRTSEFQDSAGLGIDCAKALGCKMLNCLAGIAPPGIARETAWETLVGNLRFAASALEKEGILLVVEPINFHDIPGFFLNRSAEAMAAIEACGSANAKLQYDLYHMQRMEGELAATSERLLPRIGHIQIADTPGRHEPGTGEINYPFLFQHLDRIGYAGWVGCEYRPLAGTVAGLGWLEAARA